MTLPRPIAQIYEKVADLSQYRDLVEQLPEEQRAKLNGVVFEGDSVKMDAPAIGQLVFKVSERVPTSLPKGAPCPCF